jgi:copper chaperone
MRMLSTVLASLFLSLQLFAAEPMTMKVTGMTCHNCEEAVEGEVSKVPGVKACHADHKKGTVSIETDGKTPVDQKAVVAAVTKAGFKVKK